MLQHPLSLTSVPNKNISLMTKLLKDIIQTAFAAALMTFVAFYIVGGVGEIKLAAFYAAGAASGAVINFFVSKKMTYESQ